MDSASSTAYRRYFAVFFGIVGTWSLVSLGEFVGTNTSRSGRSFRYSRVVFERYFPPRCTVDVPQRVFAGETPQRGTCFRTGKFSAQTDKLSLDYASARRLKEYLATANCGTRETAAACRIDEIARGRAASRADSYLCERSQGSH